MTLVKKISSEKLLKLMQLVGDGLGTGAQPGLRSITRLSGALCLSINAEGCLKSHSRNFGIIPSAHNSLSAAKEGMHSRNNHIMAAF